MKKSTQLWTFLLFAVCALWGASVWAADPTVPESTVLEPTQEESAEGASEAASGDAAPTLSDETGGIEETQPIDDSAVQVTAPGNITVDFKDADIQNVLRILAFKSGVNIVAGKDVTGAVTIRLVDVPWEKALDVILRTYGYAYDRQDNVIRVATIENLNREELSTEVFTLNYSRAADVEKSVKEMLSERGRIRADARSNTLIVTDMPTSVQNIRTVVARLDAATPQVLIEAKVLEMTLGSADRLGIDWNLRLAVSGSKRPTSFPFPATRTTKLEQFFPHGRGTTTGTTDTGTTTIEDFPKGQEAGGPNIQPTFPVADKLDFTFGAIDFTTASAILELISGRDDVKILSEPHVMVLNNQEAKILVGEILAIPTFERNSSTGRMEITGYDDRDLGVRLSVVPQVNTEEEIVVTIHPEITSLIGYDELTADIRAPRFTTREAVTNVRIKSGQTIAIGGLIKEDRTNRKTKVPILGDIPGLDKLFSHDSTVVTKTDLLFLMRVTVVKDVVPTGHSL